MINTDWIRELETTEVAQCTGKLKRGDAYCAIGLGLKMLGEDADFSKLGLTQSMFFTVVSWNDGDRLSFKEIAERLRSL